MAADRTVELEGLSRERLEVDKLHKAIRASMRALDYTLGDYTGGIYSITHVSGAVAATLAAGSDIASVRWSNDSKYFGLLKCEVSLAVITAVTTSVIFDARLQPVRSFTTDYTTASTATSMASNNGKLRALGDGAMNASLMGTSGPRIMTTATMSGETFTADASSIGHATWPMLLPVTATGTAVALPVGAAGAKQTLFDWTLAGYQPFVLGANEGLVVMNETAGPASGTYKYYVTWTWVEAVRM